MNTTPDPMPLFEDETASVRQDAAEPENTPEQPSSDGSSLDQPVSATPQPDAPDSPQADAPPAATPRVGSADDMDAWLSQGTRPADGWLIDDAQADAAMAAWLQADPNAAPPADTPVVVTDGGRMDRLRPKRRPLFPAWLVWVVLGVLLLGGIAAGTAGYLAVRARVMVPTVAGLQTTEAHERLATVGLTLTVSDRRFSTLPVDTILAQTPEAGASAKRGSAVTVVVSAGTEEFTMPDVVGEGLALARAQLEQKGLQVQVETLASDQPSDTVLATNPTAGAAVHTGDIVRVTVAQGIAGSATATSTLVPFSLSGIRVTLDPAAPISGQPDAGLEITRRLQSLLQASGATVVSTRSITDTGTTSSVTARQQRAREGSPTVAVGFDVVASGEAGMRLGYPNAAVATATATPSQSLSSQISSALAGQAINTQQFATGSDVVLSVTGAPYVRLTIGSTASREDLANFRDPNWADKVARAVYQGIASMYGVRNPGATP